MHNDDDDNENIKKHIFKINNNKMIAEPKQLVDHKKKQLYYSYIYRFKSFIFL